MQAAVYNGQQMPVIEERNKPKILNPKDALIRVTLTTICSSDLHILNGAVPRAEKGVILGHEFIGIVEEIGAQVKQFKPGDRVAVNVETFCGDCFFCKRGYVNNCTDPQGGWALGCRIDGGQTEYARIPYADEGMTRIPDSVTDEQALFTGDLMSTGYWAAQLGEIGKEDTVAVIGAGPTGLCTMMACRLYEPKKIIAIDINKERLRFAQEHNLADHGIDPRETDCIKALEELTPHGGADVVIEAAGGADTFELGWKIARANGTVCLVAMYEKEQILPLPQMYGKNLTFKTGGVNAAHCGRIMELICQGKLDPSILITHRTDFSKIEQAYELFRKQDGILKWAIRV